MKLGLIKVSEGIVNCGDLPEILYKIGATPIEIFSEPQSQLKIYKCIGDCFEDVPEGEMIKEYNPVFSRDKDGKLTVKL